ncbi:MAG: tail fiber domain-containing protein [Bacteroidetes bacterium]|nr:tail fiber domain-containing protein [Bacteroidota bacterium]
MYDNSTGDNNVAIGYTALNDNTIGNNNTALGTQALENSLHGSRNVAVGNSALNNMSFNNSGAVYNAYNTAVGFEALAICNPNDGNSTGTGKRNTAVGGLALDGLTTGKMCTGIGFNCSTTATADNATALGYNAIATADNNVRVGNTAVVGIFGAVNFNTSDARFKTDVADNVPGLSFVDKLRPVTYLFQKEKYSLHIGEGQDEDYVAKLRAQDASGKRSSGFLAQEVEALADSLGYDFDGIYKPQNKQDTYGLGYAQFVVPLVKAVQELKAMVEAQQKRITELERLAR